MKGTLLIENGLIATTSGLLLGYVLCAGDRILQVGCGTYVGERPARVLDAGGDLVMPGVIDDQVHFREPGLTYKADIHSESIAAVAGGVTSFMEMPNTNPPTISQDALNRKFDRAAETSVANYSFYFGATNDNGVELARLDPQRVCGVKLFMGSSTGNLLVDNEKSLTRIFAESPILVATHCEEESIVRANLAAFKARYGEAITPEMHPLIRSEEACYVCSAKAVALADKYGTDLHVLHLSTARELTLFESKPLLEKKITNEVCVHHLWFSDADYAARGNWIKWNPAVKSAADREALRAGLVNGRVDVVATDHAPHTRAEKSGTYRTTPSGGPLVQHSLNVMLELYKQQVISLETVIQKMCYAPALRFGVRDRGFLQPGYYADLVVVNLDAPWTVAPENIRYKCGWSPFEGETFTTQVQHTIINGQIVYSQGVVDTSFRGRELSFNR